MAGRRPVVRAAVRGRDRDQDRVHRDRPGFGVPGEPPQRLDPERQLRHRHVGDRGDRATSPRPGSSCRSTSTSRSTSRSWLDPEYGYAGGETTVNLFNKYKGAYYFVAFDNDTQPYFYRSDLLENPDEQAAFEDQYGRPLEFPLTWEHHDEVAAFFTRPDAEIPIFGDVNTLAPFWGAVKWNERFVSAANPNMYYFNEDGSANVNNEAGVRAFAELLASLE